MFFLHTLSVSCCKIHACCYNNKMTEVLITPRLTSKHVTFLFLRLFIRSFVYGLRGDDVGTSY